MQELWATSVEPAAMKLADFAVQLRLLGAIALFCGALRFFLAGRTRGRLFLLAGTLLFGFGITIESLEILGLYEQYYYPGWDREEFRIMDEDGRLIEVPTPPWWQMLLWWLARLARVSGLVTAAVGFVMDGRWMLQGAPGAGRRKRA